MSVSTKYRKSTPALTALLVTFGRAFAIVTVTAANVVLIAARAWLPMALTGALLSFIWYGNAQAANRHTTRAHQFAYAAGAGLGTVTGAWLASWL